MRYSMKEIAAEIPIAMADVNGKTLLERQMNALARNGIYDVHVVGGYKCDKIKVDGIKLHEESGLAAKRGTSIDLVCRGQRRRSGARRIFRYPVRRLDGCQTP